MGPPTDAAIGGGRVAICGDFRPKAFGRRGENQFKNYCAASFASEFAPKASAHTPRAIITRRNKLVRLPVGTVLGAAAGSGFWRISSQTRLLSTNARFPQTPRTTTVPDALEMALRLAKTLCPGGSNDDGWGNRLPVEHATTLIEMKYRGDEMMDQKTNGTTVKRLAIRV